VKTAGHNIVECFTSVLLSFDGISRSWEIFIRKIYLYLKWERLHYCVVDMRCLLRGDSKIKITTLDQLVKHREMDF